MRLRVPGTFTYDGSPVQIEEGRLLKVFDEQGDEVLVRTTEANVKESAVARVPNQDVEVLGTDESEIWGMGGASQWSGDLCDDGIL